MTMVQESAVITSVAELELVKARNAIDQFIYSCSHTMRGPLKSIAGLVYLLKKSLGTPTFDPESYLQSIESTIAKLETVLNDLEQFLTNSNQDITTRSINVKELMSTVLKEFQVSIEEKKILPRISIKQVAPLYTDDNALRILVTHLISNAVMYQDLNKSERKISITIKVSVSSCRIAIRDNGIGIRDEIRSSIFYPFFKGSVKSSGAGVGLYVANAVLHKMGGALSVTSKHGSGTCFSFSIPNLSA
jgi:signal transduction histidine kinase